MVNAISEKQDQLARLCKQFGVKRFEVFGSAAGQGGFNSDSDLDFLVEFLPTTPTQHSDAYFGLLDALRSLFHRPVDLLEIRAIHNPYLMESINRQRVELYAA
jgi:uncharacterized protein